MWMVVYIAQSKETAERISALLRDAGMLVKIRVTNQGAQDQYGCFEILVPESEVDGAHTVIIDAL